MEEEMSEKIIIPCRLKGQGFPAAKSPLFILGNRIIFI